MNPKDLTNVNGKLFFSGTDGTHGYELWKTDGTTAGTSMLADINPGTGSSYPSNLTNVNGTLFFAADEELWKSDGTAGGTVELTFIYNPPSYNYNPGTGLDPNELTNVNGTLFFTGNEVPYYMQLWKSDGTADGTVMVSDSALGYSALLGDLTSVNGTLYFPAVTDPSGGLYKSDGTEAGTVKVSGVEVAGPISNVNGDLYFAGNDGTHGTQLWKSDGTTAGTAMVEDINPGISTTVYYTGSYGTYTRSIVRNNANPTDLTNVNGTLYFAADDGTHGDELWQSDGTAAGTTLVQDIYPGSSWQTVSTGTGYYGGTETGRAYLPNSSNPSFLTNLNGTLLFSANDGNGNQLWMLPAATGKTTAASLSVGSFPSSTTAGAPGSFTVTALNADGTTDTSYTGTVHFTSSDGQAVLPGDYAFTTADQGVHTFSATLKTAGTQSLTATDTTSGSVTGSDSGITVAPAAASQLMFAQQPSTTTAGQAINPAVTVAVADQYGNLITSDSSSVTLTLSSGAFEGGSATDSAAASGGVATFGTLKMDTAGSYTLNATDGSLTSATSAGFTIEPAAASTLSVTGFPSPSTAGVAGNFTVTLRDSYGNIASGYTGTVHFTSSDAKAVLPADYGFTSTDAGTHTFSATLKTAGTQSITATDTAAASLTATEATITVNPAAASKFVLTAPANINAGASFSLTLKVEDAYGNVVTNYTGTVHFSSTDRKATLSSNYTFTTAQKGVHTFSGLALRTRGCWRVSFTLAGEITARPSHAMRSA